MPSYGQTGRTFADKNVANKFGKENTQAGLMGEQALHKKMKDLRFDFDYSIWSSMRTPASRNGGKTYDTDIDFAIANGNTLILIDAKKWSAKNFWWSLGGNVMFGFGFSRDRNGRVKKVSKNMAMSLDRTRKELPGIRVEGMVIFVPTIARGDLPSSVSLLRWGNGIRSYLMNPGLNKVKRTLGKPKKVDSRISAFCGRLARA